MCLCQCKSVWCFPCLHAIAIYTNMCHFWALPFCAMYNVHQCVPFLSLVLWGNVQCTPMCTILEHFPFRQMSMCAILEHCPWGKCLIYTNVCIRHCPFEYCLMCIPIVEGFFWSKNVGLDNSSVIRRLKLIWVLELKVPQMCIQNWRKQFKNWNKNFINHHLVVKYLEAVYKSF